MPPQAKRLKLFSSAAYDNVPGIDQVHKQSRNRLKSSFEAIFDKYGKDFSGVSDEIDLNTGEVIVDNGHLANITDDTDIGPDPGVVRKKKAAMNTMEDHGDSDDELSSGMPEPKASPSKERALVLYRQADPSPQISPTASASTCSNGGWVPNSSMPTMPAGQPLNIFDPNFMQKLIEANMKQMLHSGQLQSIIPQSKWGPPPLSQDPFVQQDQDQACGGPLSIKQSEHHSPPKSAQSQRNTSMPSIWAPHSSPTDRRNPEWTAEKDRYLKHLITKHDNGFTLSDIARRFPQHTYISVYYRFHKLKKRDQAAGWEQKSPLSAPTHRVRMLSSNLRFKDQRNSQKGARGADAEVTRIGTNSSQDPKKNTGLGDNRIRPRIPRTSTGSINYNLKDAMRSQITLKNPLAEKSSSYNPEKIANPSSIVDSARQPKATGSDRPRSPLSKSTTHYMEFQSTAKPCEAPVYGQRVGRPRRPSKPEPQVSNVHPVDSSSPQSKTLVRTRGEAPPSLSHVPFAPGMSKPYVLEKGTFSCPLVECPYSRKNFGITWRTTEHMKLHHGWPRPSKNDNMQSFDDVLQEQNALVSAAQPLDEESVSVPNGSAGSELHEAVEDHSESSLKSTEGYFHDTLALKFKRAQPRKSAQRSKNNYPQPWNSLDREMRGQGDKSTSTNVGTQQAHTFLFPQVVIPYSTPSSNSTSSKDSIGEQNGGESGKASETADTKKLEAGQKRKQGYLNSPNNKWRQFADLAQPAKPAPKPLDPSPEQLHKKAAFRNPKEMKHTPDSNSNTPVSKPSGQADATRHVSSTPKKKMSTSRETTVSGPKLNSSNELACSPLQDSSVLRKVSSQDVYPLFQKASTPLRQSAAAGSPPRTSLRNSSAVEEDSSEDELAL
ncbi:MAG: hypothetical protein M1831_000933 [Alyxoria varia]|nr:MAG: hypothetical protein M1831_000933 [Alyxoria varia]